MPSGWFESMNFPLILVVLTFVTGVIWLIDVLMFARARRTDDAQPILVEYAASFFPVLLIVLVLRSFIFEPFRIPSGSMIPTLLVGDFILVSKFSYGVRLPVIHTKILETGKPARGDVAVFRFPDDPSVDYIKRVIGLPGDSIVYRNKQLFINGEEIKLSGADPYVLPGTDDVMFGMFLRHESIGDADHDILVSDSGSAGMREYQTVPAGHYFMMGDNRDNSSDSRRWGFVPEANLVGRAKYVWMHWNSGILWSRLGDRIE